MGKNRVLCIFFDFSPKPMGMAGPLKREFDCLSQSRSNDLSKGPVIRVNSGKKLKKLQKKASSESFFNFSPELMRMTGTFDRSFDLL
jgi:hypothetical protein